MDRDNYIVLNNARFDLYKKGLNDVEISEQLGCSAYVIFCWRKKYGLASNEAKTVEQRLALYLQGLSDREIADIQQLDASTIASWRHRHDLPLNKSKPKNKTITMDKRFARLYDKKYIDREIAKRCGVSISSVHDWRKATGRPPHRVSREESDRRYRESIKGLIG